jgi:cell division protein FtsB
MKRMQAKSIVAVVLAAMLLFCAQAFAGGTPRGKPFIELQGQIVEVEGEISTLQDQVDSIVAKVDTIEGKVAANNDAIASLEDQNAVLQGQLNASVAELQAEIASLEAANADLQAQIDDGAGDIAAAQADIAFNDGLISALTQKISELNVDLQDQIDNNMAMIGALETEIGVINEILDEKLRVVSGSCPEGEAVIEITADGSVVCGVVVGGGDAAIEMVRVSRFDYQAPSSYLEVEAICPAGYSITGGGFLAYPHGGVIGSLSVGNAWKVHIDNKTESVLYSFAYANCIKMVAP